MKNIEGFKKEVIKLLKKYDISGSISTSNPYMKGEKVIFDPISFDIYAVISRMDKYYNKKR